MTSFWSTFVKVVFGTFASAGSTLMLITWFQAFIPAPIPIGLKAQELLFGVAGIFCVGIVLAMWVIVPLYQLAVGQLMKNIIRKIVA